MIQDSSNDDNGDDRHGDEDGHHGDADAGGRHGDEDAGGDSVDESEVHVRGCGWAFCHGVGIARMRKP